ncbi:prepilin-type N-terminal cleavage/methylation domain-containing protein [Caulobacter sp. S45]|uniref:prepilin-type N-terminal cleavage/methylation domain-containing protein n=1 Tax=Caulobacter sp. S45 TaxID=1641861 RepID=UPI001576B915|nr:prepilin-type N-terminal cleavage/methylation domain-containing protein [Caulobacter sp. S45]
MERPRADVGFTLVEMLVSLALLGMAAVLVGQGLGSDHAALGRIERRTQGGEAVAAAQTLLRERLQHLFADPRYDSLSMFVDFDGAEQELQFLASAPSGASGIQVQRFKLGLSGGALSFGPVQAIGADAGLEPPKLLGGVQGLEIAYWGADAADATPAWRPTWERRPAPPQLVRIRLAFAPEDRRSWPDLIVRPAAMVNADCIYDAREDGCRGGS